MASKRLASVRPVAQNLKGVGLYPVHLRGEAGAIGLEIPLRHFKRGAGGVNARDLAANLGQVQRKAALVAANVERAARWRPSRLRPIPRGGVVGPLVEKGAGLLPGVGVVVEDEAVEVKLRSWRAARLSCSVERLGRWARPALPARACAGSGRSRMAAGASSSRSTRTQVSRTPAESSPLARSCRITRPAYLSTTRPGNSSASLKQSRQASFSASSIGLRRAMACAQPCSQQAEPFGFVDGLARDQPQRDLRRRAVERRAQQQAAMIGHGQQCRRVSVAGSGSEMASISEA